MRRPHAARSVALAVAGLLALPAPGCDSPVQQGSAPPPLARSGAARAAGDAGAADDGAAPPIAVAISDNDFTESDRTRDPFRSFAREFVPVGPQVQVVENEIKLREYAIDELRLVAVIVGTGNPYAMVIDPTGRGTIIRRGDYVGRPDTVASGPEGSMPHQVPWRVARIVGSRVRRDSDNNLDEIPGEVVFEREDRLNPTAGRAERSITLNPAQAARGAAPTEPAQPSLPPLPGFGAGGGSPFLPTLPPPTGARSGTGEAAAAQGPQPGVTYVQSYTTVVPPPQQPPPQPTTIVIQTGPQGQTTVSGAGQGQGSAAAPQGPRDPYAPPPGGSNVPPPVQINSGSTYPVQPLPSSGLPR